MWDGKQMRGRRARLAGALALAAAVATLALTLASPTGAADAGALGDQVLGPVRDTIIGPLSRRERRATISGEQGYPTGDGHTVQIDVDGGPDHPLNPLAFAGQDREQIARDFAHFLGTRLHGDEMDRLHVFVTDQTGIATDCGGPGILACYRPSDQRITAEPPSDQEPGNGDPSPSFVITHEYGHHIAQNRINRPWDAIDWGPKRWASYEAVCPGARSGRYHPGDEGTYYDENPGEAWAESYAFRAYPPNQVRWDIWDPALKPDQGAFDRIYADVKRPWTNNRTRSWHSEFTAGGGSLKRRRFRTTLDGNASATLWMPSGANYHMRLFSGADDPLAEGHGAWPSERATFKVCGTRRLAARVQRVSGHGPFTIKVSRP